MKKIFKKSNIFSSLLGAIMFGSVGVVASGLLAKDVTYTPKDTTWKVDNVESAINDLYTKARDYKKLDTETTVSEGNLLSGIIAYDNNGKLIRGTFERGVVSNTFTFQSNYTVPIGFRPSFVCIYIEYDYSNGKNGTVVIYNGTKWFAINAKSNSNGTYVQNASDFSITDNGFSIGDVSGWTELNKTVSYVAIK